MKAPIPLSGALAIALFAVPTAAQEHEDMDEMRDQMHGVEYLNRQPQATGLPFSEAVRVGQMLYLSGQIGIDPATGQLAPGGIGPETRQTMTNIQATLERYGSSMDRVIKCTVMLGDIGEWAAMNEVYVTFFPTNKPARSAFGTSGLALNSRVEIECIATVGDM